MSQGAMNGYANISTTELQALLAKGNVCLVDVRTEAEIARGHIEGALKLPLHVLPMRLHELDAKGATVFYCQGGGRSAQAAAFAAGQGFSEVYNLQGGIVAWVQSGAPISG